MNNSGCQEITNNRFNAKQWLLLSLLIRLTIMPFTMHGDLLFVYGTPHFLAHGQWDAYSIAWEKFDRYYYPPLSLVLFASVQLVFRFLFSGYETFLHSVAVGEISSLNSSDDIFLVLFLLKIPYLIVDLMLVWTCWGMLSGDDEKRSFTALWAVNPLVIYGEYIIGQSGLIPAFCVLLACYFSLKKGKEHYACVAIGMGCLMKLFPIIFLPLVLCLTSRTPKDAVRLSLYCLVPVAVGFGMFYMISGTAVFKVANVASSASKNTGIFPVWAMQITQAAIYGAICVHILMNRKRDFDYTLIIQYFLVVYLALYASSPIWQTYYFEWFVPFVILYVHKKVALKNWFYCFMLVLFMAGLRSRESAFGAFAPLNPELFLSIPSLRDVVGFLFNLDIYSNTLTVAFYALHLFLLSAILKSIFSRPIDGGVNA